MGRPDMSILANKVDSLYNRVDRLEAKLLRERERSASTLHKVDMLAELSGKEFVKRITFPSELLLIDRLEEKE